MTLRATNVMQKVQFIVQHFRYNVAGLLNGEAKAMIVTNSRPAAARYKIALEKYIKENPEYSAYQILVAFYGKLTGKQISHTADKDTERASFERNQLDIEVQKLVRFKGDLSKFSRIYSYVAQLIDFGDPELENFSAFSNLLSKRLYGLPAKEINISGVVLTGYSIFKNKFINEEDLDFPSDIETPALTPIKGISHDDVQPTKIVYLKEVIDLISQTFGDIATREDQVVYVNHLVTILQKDATVMAQVENNSKFIALQGNLLSAAESAIIQALSSHQDLYLYSIFTKSIKESSLCPCQNT